MVHNPNRWKFCLNLRCSNIHKDLLCQLVLRCFLRLMLLVFHLILMLVILFIFFLDAFFSEEVDNYEEIYYEFNPYIFHWPLRYLFTYSKSRNRWFKSLLYKHRSSSTRLSDCVFNKKST